MTWHSILIVAFFALTIGAFAANAKDECLSCHQNLGSPEAQGFLKDIHHAQGLTCAGCHGGDPNSAEMESAMDPNKGFIGAPKKQEIPQLCGKCHGPEATKTTKPIDDVLTYYSSSVHAKALKESPDGPQCVSCHGVHGILKASDADSPVSANNVSKTCGKCHAVLEDLFEKSPHKEPFQTMGLPACVTCHGNHSIHPPTDSMVGLDKISTCGTCHSQKDAAAKMIISARATLDRLANGKREAEADLTHAEQLGMDVTEAKYSLKDATQASIEARVKIHSFKLSPVEESAKPGLKIIADAKNSAKTAVQEYYFRRKGLGISTFLLTVLVALLYIKIRSIETRQKTDHPND